MKRIRENLISLIMPAYRQEKTIEEDIKRISNVMDHLPYDYEVIVVVDGMDDKTFERAEKLARKNILVIGYEHNHGKGYAIRYGMVRSRGGIVGFIDAGMDLDPSEMSIALGLMKSKNADMIIGSKRHPDSKVNYPIHRKLISFLSQAYIVLLFGLNVKDTQVGMKFFKRKVIEDVLPRLLVKRFAFDIEMLVVAYDLGYKRVYESPVNLDFNIRDSIVSKNLLSNLMRTFWDSLAIFYRLKLVHYYDDQNQRKWKYDPELEFKINVG